ncbi:uncharacterized protein LOC125771064 [Anopheles funestus]|uniref:uncharacterized protein LOC125771064 n=1 Tax=Anopheles funestus TaxID=62324 RepID=UPI0020C745CD|nr:uncharacterized protein LOC125771064 [Anopheles funestus]
MHLIWATLLAFVAVVYTAPGPCDLPSLSEVGSQYLVFGQDCRQYAYGYNAGSSAKVEVKNANGTVFGAYHYIDANNVTQRVNYTANDVDGFLVEASNLPVPVKDTNVEDSTVTDVPTTFPTVAQEEKTTQSNLVRDSVSGVTEHRNTYFKPILSVWYPASSYTRDPLVVQNAEVLAQKTEMNRG